MTTPNLTPADAQTPRILWGGGECPAHPDAVVVVEWRNGRRSRDVCAVVLDWRHLDDLGDIVAFWVISSPDPDDIARYQPAVEPKRATPRPLRLDEMEHPMQPIGLDDDGVVRFKPNAIVRWLLDTHKCGLSDIVRMPWAPEDYTHLMQLIGYSVSGYGDLPTSPAEVVALADAEAEAVFVAIDIPLPVEDEPVVEGEVSDG
jgi:hypothetical protein